MGKASEGERRRRGERRLQKVPAAA